MNLAAVSTFIFDLDGVLWRGETPVEGAVAAINELLAAGKRCLYCTNNSSRTQADYVEKLLGMGIESVSEDEIVTSSSATALYLSAQYTGPFLAYVIGEEGIRTALQKIGARIVPDSDINGDTNVDCVIVGIDREFSYEKMNTAQRLIRQGALFVATNRDSTYPVEGGIVPGAGSVVAAVETASASTPVTVGKPRPVMVQLVIQKYGLDNSEIAFVGDRLDTDIACARRAGVAALLVTTGVTTLQEARRAKGEQRPDAVFPDLTALAELALHGEVKGGEVTGEIASNGANVVPSDAVPAPDAPPESAPAVEEAPAEAAESTSEVSSVPADSLVPAENVEAPAATEEADKAVPPADVEWDDSWFADVEDEKKANQASQAASEAAGDAAPSQDSKEEAEDNVFDWKLD